MLVVIGIQAKMKDTVHMTIVNIYVPFMSPVRWHGASWDGNEVDCINSYGWLDGRLSTAMRLATTRRKAAVTATIWLGCWEAFDGDWNGYGWSAERNTIATRTATATTVTAAAVWL